LRRKTMISNQNPNNNIKISSFDRICELAEHKNEVALLDLLKNEACVDVNNASGETPAGKLASERKRGAAAWLMLFGANISKIAKGSAQGKDHAFSEYLRNEFGACVDYIAKGAAFIGDFAYVEFLRTKHYADINCIARGAARGGFSDYVNGLCKEHKIDINEIAYEAARGGHTSYAEELRINKSADVNFIGRGAIKNHNFDYVKTLIREHGADIAVVKKSAAEIGKRYENGVLSDKPEDILYSGYATEYIQSGYCNYQELDNYFSYPNIGFIQSLFVAALRGGHLNYAAYLYNSFDKKMMGILIFADGVIKSDVTCSSINQLSAQLKRLPYLFASIEDATFRRIFSYTLYGTVVSSFIHKSDRYCFASYERSVEAKEISQIVVKNRINYFQALALRQPGLKTWLLQKSNFHTKIPKVLHYHINSFLHPWDFAEIEKTNLIIYKNHLNYKLQAYIKQKGIWGFFTAGSARKLAESCKKVENMNHLGALLENEMKKQSDDKNEYSKMLKDLHRKYLF
jgi:hypothetical protein